MSPEITIVSSVEDWFETALREVVRSEKAEVDSLTQHYVVSVLSEAESSEKDALDLGTRPLPVVLAEAESKAAAERFELFRRVGDHVLLTQGFFRARSPGGPTPDYFVTIGSEAYLRASRVLVGADASAFDPLRSLARRFGEWLELLHRLYEYVLAHSKNEARDLVHLLGLWSKERSPGLERVLRGRGVSLSGARLLPS